MKLKTTANKVIYLFIQQKGLCMYCKRPFEEIVKNGEIVNIDHIKAKSKGGSNELKNLALTCYKCNKNKADKSEKMLGVWKQFDIWKIKSGKI